MLPLVLLLSADALAFSSGKTGSSVTGCTCHGSSATSSVTLGLTPSSTSVAPGETVSVTFTVATTATRTHAGLNVSATSGTLAAGTSTRLTSSQITHSAATAGSGGFATFGFTWVAPSTEGSYTLYAAGNAVNNNGSSSGDAWNTTSTTITVVDPCTDADGDGYDVCTTGTSTDCDDTDTTIHDGATEVVADGVDQNCDGADLCYTDADLDGFGGSTTRSASDLDCVDSGESTVSTDCNDSSSAIKPTATEITGDEVDQNCDNHEVCYSDVDRDGYGTSSSTVTSTDTDCDDSGESSLATDCNDSASSVSPGASEVCDASNTDEDCDSLADDSDSAASGKSTWYRDQDSDTYGTSTTTLSRCDQPSGYVSTSGDCNDSSSSVNPGASEVCDASNTDEDCDSLADDADSSVSSSGKSTYYLDADSDSYGGSTSGSYCDRPTGYVSTGGDCNDSSASISPGDPEICDASNTDEDCDSLADDADSSATGKSTWYRDADSDTYGTSSTTSSACDRPTGYVSSSTDCDDTSSAAYPGATETCSDTVDLNCDGSTSGADLDGDGYAACEECDDGDAAVKPGVAEIAGDELDQNCDGAETCYRDGDRDGFGTSSTVTSADLDCDDAGESVTTTDCSDSSSASYPSAPELCDSLDNDCDGSVDESAVDMTVWYVDADGDGHGGLATTLSCSRPTGYAATSGDCDDSDSAYYPSAAETCTDSEDYNCDGAVGGVDTDGDGYYACEECDDRDAAVSPDATESCNGVDDDCDGLIDPDGSAGGATWYMDMDADGYGDPDMPLVACARPEGYVDNDDDCDDSRSELRPGAPEDDCADATDYNCDGSVAYEDADEDGVAACEDCNDADGGVYGGATETCDDVDQDCDGDLLEDFDDSDGDLSADCVDADDDDDGLTDSDEADLGTDPLEPDSDGDGLSDGDEVAAGTDPTDPTNGDDDGGDGGPDDEEDSGGADGSGGSEGSGEDGSGGKGKESGCATAPTPSALGGLWLGLTALLGLRRRR